MTSITALIKGIERTRVTRLDIWRESLAGVGRFEIALDNQDNSYPPETFEPQDLVELKINDTSMTKGYVDDILSRVDDPAAVYHNLITVLGRDYGQDLVNLFLTKKYLEVGDGPSRADMIIDDALEEAGAEITYTPNMDKQEEHNLAIAMYGNNWPRVGQRKTLNSIKVHRLEFLLWKYGNPTGDVSAVIRKVSDDSIIQSAVICSASSLPSGAGWRGVTFESPPLINEEVRLLVEYSDGDVNNCIYCEIWAGSSVKGDEVYTVYFEDEYTDVDTRDTAYRIYLDPWPNKTYEFKRTHLLDGFCDLAKFVDADFYVDDSKALQLFPLSAAESSGVTLKSIPGDATNNILALDQVGEKVGFDIKNYIHVEAGNVDDHWTERNAADWTPGGTTTGLADDSIVFVKGAASIRFKASNPASGAAIQLVFPMFFYDTLDVSASQAQVSLYTKYLQTSNGYVHFRVILTDDNDNVIAQYHNLPERNKWYIVSCVFGINEEIGGSMGEGTWGYLSGSNFTWKIKRISFVYANENVWLWEMFWVDGLKMTNISARAIAEDSGEGSSQETYRKRMTSITRNDIKSQPQLNAIAVDELAKRKDSMQKLKVTATFQPNCKYAGQTVVVKAPSSGIGTAETGVIYRILGLHHVAEPRTDLLRGFDAITEFDLVKHETASVQPTDPLRFRHIDNPTQIEIERVWARLRALERSYSEYFFLDQPGQARYT